MANVENSMGSESVPAQARTLEVLDQFLATIRRAAEIGLTRTSGRTALEQAAGLRHVLGLVGFALAMRLHDADPLHPELTHIMDPHRKWGGDNMDSLYLAAAVSSDHTYRVHGNRGTVKYISFVIQDRSVHFAGNISGMLLGRDLKSDADGNFELFLGGQERSGNWLPLRADTDRLVIRQFFADWEERPMSIMIERLGGPVPPPLLTSEKIFDGVAASGQLVETLIPFWQDLMDMYRARPNEFINFREATRAKMKDINATPGGTPYCCHWKVPRDSALVIRVKPPKSEFWNLEFCNSWWETNDYRYRLTGTNMHHAVLEADGELIAVVSHDDPGVPNWFDTSGFTEGMMDLRWIGADSSPVPECTLVKREALGQSLPKNVRRITSEERQAQLLARHRGIYNRFHWM